MINAAEARKLSDSKLYNVTESEGFKSIIARLDIEIRTAIADGLESITVKTHLLHVMSGYKLPNGLNREAIDVDHFWWKYVRGKLERCGYKISSTITCDTYRVSW